MATTLMLASEVLGGGNLATRVHTDLKINLEAMLKAAAAIVGIGISFEHNGASVALDAYT
eukprot:CAMPEP_0185786456 /NCGR_PEP_ID=MMETSP1174-20130828/135475_1 /TAXON_ID=35687 /ORGANISM="Dictyocha speculum, Strain CCMP1381" /LENGTH=59 /DNA_ID=CAMNT_0028479109 /DNA_START=91 /DNA_END=267 /DNA_ORIENTATION=-